MTHMVERLGHVTYGVTDLDAVVETMTRFGRLHVTERTDAEAFLTGGPQHYWLRLVTAPENGVVRVGYELASDATFEEIQERLETESLAFETSDAADGDRVQRWLRFRDHDDIEIEIFAGMADARSPREDPRVRLEEMLHAVYYVTDTVATAELYGRVLGFEVSDWIEDWAAFLRCGNGFHHSLAFFRQPEQAGKLAHYCVLCEDFDDVMRARRDVLDGGGGPKGDLIRHAASGSVSIYLEEPTSGLNYEFCTWHERIDPATDHQPRRLPRGRSTHDVWAAVPDAPPAHA